MSEKILFLTGKLAERQLRRILSSMKPEFQLPNKSNRCKCCCTNVRKHYYEKITKEQDVDRIIVPGKFRGDLKKLRDILIFR